MSDANTNKRIRKHIADGVVSETHQKKAREEDVTDDEVEEFYAILRRINTAVKYFKSCGDGVASFEKEIMRELNSESTRTSRAREEEEEHLHHNNNLNLDLNLTPHQ